MRRCLFTLCHLHHESLCWAYPGATQQHWPRGRSKNPTLSDSAKTWPFIEVSNNQVRSLWIRIFHKQTNEKWRIVQVNERITKNHTTLTPLIWNFKFCFRNDVKWLSWPTIILIGIVAKFLTGAAVVGCTARKGLWSKHADHTRDWERRQLRRYDDKNFCFPGSEVPATIFWMPTMTFSPKDMKG